jgi:hypothetical protein
MSGGHEGGMQVGTGGAGHGKTGRSSYAPAGGRAGNSLYSQSIGVVPGWCRGPKMAGGRRISGRAARLWRIWIAGVGAMQTGTCAWLCCLCSKSLLRAPDLWPDATNNEA